MRIKKCLKRRRIYKTDRGTWRIVYGDKYLKFYANGRQSIDIIEGFIRSIIKEEIKNEEKKTN